MATISITVPSDGTTIDASDVATPLNTIVTEINGSLDSDNISDGGVVPNNLTSGTGTSWAWQSWTPTWTGVTEGNGTTTAVYTQIGKTVHFLIRITLGSTSGMGSTIFSLPVTATSNFLATKTLIGSSYFHDSSTGFGYVGYTRLESSTTGRAITFNTSAGVVGISSSVPFTWATGDQLVITGTYEAA